MKKPVRLDDDCVVFPSTGVFGAHYCRTCGAVELSQIFDTSDGLDDYLFWRQMGDEPFCLYCAGEIDRRLYDSANLDYIRKLIALLSPDVLAKLKPCKKEIHGEGSGVSLVRV